MQRAQGDLTFASGATARAQTPFGPSKTDSMMAGVAEHALFTEAILGAMHARLAEVKSVTHG